MRHDVVEVAWTIGGHFEVEAGLPGRRLSLPGAWVGRNSTGLGILAGLRRRLVTLGWLVALRRLVTRRRNIAGLRRLGAGLRRLWCFIWGTHGITLDRRLKDA
ncbi:hypothetical protein GCM10010523_02690 [Paenarthrobacter ilicis]